MLGLGTRNAPLRNGRLLGQQQTKLKSYDKAERSSRGGKYIYIYAYIYTYAYTHTHTHTHTYIYIYIKECPTPHQVKTDGQRRGLRVHLRWLSWTSALHQIFTDHMLWIRSYTRWWDFPGGTVGKNLPTSAGDTRDLRLIPVLGTCPVGNGNPLQYSCLENPMDRGAWWATVHGVAESGTQLSDWAQYNASTGWWGYSSEQKRLSLPDWHLYSDIGAQEAECNWGLASFKPWFSCSLAMCLRANHLISLNLFFFLFFICEVGVEWYDARVMHAACTALSEAMLPVRGSSQMCLWAPKGGSASGVKQTLMLKGRLF